MKKLLIMMTVASALMLAVNNAKAISLVIDEGLTDDNHFTFDIFWGSTVEIGDPNAASDIVFDSSGNILWRAVVKDFFPASLRLLDVDVFRNNANTAFTDLWSFFLNEDRTFQQVNWEGFNPASRTFQGIGSDTQGQGIPAVATFTPLADNFGARVAYEVSVPDLGSTVLLLGLALVPLFGWKQWSMSAEERE